MCAFTEGFHLLGAAKEFMACSLVSLTFFYSNQTTIHDAIGAVVKRSSFNAISALKGMLPG